MDLEPIKETAVQVLTSPTLEKSTRNLFKQIGASLLTFIDYLGGLFLLAKETVNVMLHLRFPFYPFLQACEFVGVKSLGIVLTVAIFMGMVFALQFAVGLSRFGLEIYVGQVVGLSIVRELGPVLTCLMLSARVGSGIAAELGSMVVTEQVLAIEALGADPIHKLVLPRVFAITIAAPLLTVFANIIGILGGMLIAVLEADVTSRFYFDQVRQSVDMGDFLSGIAKTVFFGFFIGLIACYQGLKTTGGTAGVGRATTNAVVSSSLMVFILDFFLTKLFLAV